VMAREVPAEDAVELRSFVEEHHLRTGSARAAAMLADWDHALAGFRQLTPIAAPPTPVLPVPAEALEAAAKPTA
jgi:glutamate synthase domain-containing protein 3